MRQWKTYTAFYRPIKGHSVEHQRKLVLAYVQQRGGRIVAEYTANLKSLGERDEWIARTRKTEAAIVAGLFVIPEPAAKGSRPTADYARAMMQLFSRAGIVVEAMSGITSADGEAWENLIYDHSIKTARGRVLTTREAKKMSAESQRRRGPDIAPAWNAPNMRAEKIRWQQHWRDPAFSSARKAFDAMPADIRESLGSYRTAINVLGKRRPGDKSAGGRPPKKPKK